MSAGSSDEENDGGDDGDGGERGERASASRSLAQLNGRGMKSTQVSFCCYQWQARPELLGFLVFFLAVTVSNCSPSYCFISEPFGLTSRCLQIFALLYILSYLECSCHVV